MTRHVELDGAGWGNHSRYTLYPEGDTLLRQPWMDGEEWTKRVRDWMAARPGLLITQLRGGWPGLTTDIVRVRAEAMLLVGECSYSLCLGTALFESTGILLVELEGPRLEHHYGCQATVKRDALLDELYQLFAPFAVSQRVHTHQDGGASLSMCYAEV